MSEKTTTAVATKEKDSKSIEFVPFGAKDKVKLSIEMVKNLIAVRTKSGKTCSDQDAIKFIAMCQARRLNPFEGDAFLIGYEDRDGTPKYSLITSHQAFLKRAELNPEYDGMKSGIIIEREGQMIDLEGDFHLESDRLMGGWATVFFKNRRQSMHKRIRLKRFQKSFGIWQEDPAGMICKCAEADALRSSFPTMLGGLYLKAEVDALPSEPKLATPIFAEPVPEKKIEDKKPEDPRPALVQGIRELCKASKIGEGVLMEFLQTIGLAEDGQSSLDELDEDELDEVMQNFAKYAEKIKEVME